MKLKKLIFLVIILALLFSAVFVKKSGILSPKPDSAKDATEASLMTEALTKSDVKKISITHPSGVSIVMSKNDSGSWKIDNQYGAPTRQNSVDNFLEQIWKVRGEIRAENTEVLGDFGLTDKTAISIRLDTSLPDKFQEVYLSTKRPKGSQNFVRLANVARVIATHTDLLATLNIFSDENKPNYRVFADFRPAGIEASKVESLEITNVGAKPLVFEKKKSSEGSAPVWSLKDDAAEIDTAKINEFLSSLYNLYGNDVLDPAKAGKDFTGQNPWIRLQWKNGDKLEPFSIYLGAQAADKKNRALKADPSGVFYELPESQLEPLLKKNKESFIKQKGA